jgi:hypothetical protein
MTGMESGDDITSPRQDDNELFSSSPSKVPAQYLLCRRHDPMPQIGYPSLTNSCRSSSRRTSRYFQCFGQLGCDCALNGRRAEHYERVSWSSETENTEAIFSCVKYYLRFCNIHHPSSIIIIKQRVSHLHNLPIPNILSSLSSSLTLHPQITYNSSVTRCFAFCASSSARCFAYVALSFTLSVAFAA